MSKFIKVFHTTGFCDIHKDRVVSDWHRIPHLWSISRWNNEFRLIRRLRKNSACTTVKVAITQTDAYTLIDNLNLQEQLSSIFRHASTWKTA